MLRIYLDHAATTPVLPAVAEEVQRALREEFGNPSSLHAGGRSARTAIERSRRQVAALIGADAEEIVWTSGGTESCNLAIRGVVKKAGERVHLITSQIEHHAVLETCRELEAEGHEVTYLPPDEEGRVRVEDVAASLRPDTVMITIMLANNEIGTLQPLEEIARIVKPRGVLVHSDAVQAVGHIPVDVDRLGVDLLSFTAHKLYGPKGVGALYVRRGVRARLSPLFAGGGQEGRLRPGTENTPAIVGFGAAAEHARADLALRSQREREWRDRLIDGLLEKIPGARLNGSRTERLPGNVHLTIPGVTTDTLLIQLDLEGISASSGSACVSGSVKPSHVLKALGRSEEEASGSLRLSLGRMNDEAQIEKVLDRIPAVVERIRQTERLRVPRG